MKTRNRNRAFSILAAIVLAAFSLPAIAGALGEGSPAMLPTATNLIRLKKADSLGVILNDREVQERMRDVLGEDIGKYFSVTEIIEIPETKNNEIYAFATAREAGRRAESFFDLNLSNKKLCVIIRQDAHLFVYGADSAATLPEYAREYIDDLRLRLGKADKLNVRFKKVAAVAKDNDRKQSQSRNLRTVAVISY